MKSLHNIDASYWKCWKAQEEVKDMIRGTPEDNFMLIPSYLYVMGQINEGTIVTINCVTTPLFTLYVLKFVAVNNYVHELVYVT